MPFIDSSTANVQSRRYIPTYGPDAGSNYANTGVNQALTSGAIADHIKQLDRSNPGMNLGQRLTTRARDAIVGIMGDSRTGGRFDANQKYYQDLIKSQLDSEVGGITSRFDTERAQVKERMAQQGNGAGAAGNAAQGILASPLQRGLPASATAGKIGSGDGPMRDVVVPVAGQRRQFEQDMSDMQLDPNGENTPQSVVAARGKAAKGAYDFINQQKDLDTDRTVRANSAKVTATDAKKKANNEAKYQENYRNTRGQVKANAREAVNNVLGRYENQLGRSTADIDKKTGKPRPRQTSDINTLMTMEQMPYGNWSRQASPGRDGIPGTEDDERAAYVPNRQELLQNPQVQAWALQQIHDTIGQGRYGKDRETESYAKMYLQQLMGQQGQAGNPAPASNGMMQAQPLSSAPPSAPAAPVGQAAQPAAPTAPPSAGMPTVPPDVQADPIQRLQTADPQKATMAANTANQQVRNGMPLSQVRAGAERMRQQGFGLFADALLAQYQRAAQSVNPALLNQ